MLVLLLQPLVPVTPSFSWGWEVVRYVSVLFACGGRRELFPRTFPWLRQWSAEVPETLLLLVLLLLITLRLLLVFVLFLSVLPL